MSEPAMDYRPNPDDSALNKLVERRRAGRATEDLPRLRRLPRSRQERESATTRTPGQRLIKNCSGTIHPNTKEAAMRRYAEDQHAAERTASETVRRREQRPFVVLLKSLSTTIASLHHGIVHKGMRTDEAVVFHLAAKLARWYSMGTSFVLAFVLGFVSRKTRDERARHCASCSFRRQPQEARASERKGGLGKITSLPEDIPIQSYCYGKNGGQGCGCLELRWWFFSQLWFKLYLNNVPCPLGKFGRSFSAMLPVQLILAALVVVGLLLGGACL